MGDSFCAVKDHSVLLDREFQYFDPMKINDDAFLRENNLYLGRNCAGGYFPISLHFYILDGLKVCNLQPQLNTGVE